VQKSPIASLRLYLLKLSNPLCINEGNLNHGVVVAPGVADWVGGAFDCSERITVSRREAYIARTIVSASRAAVRTPVTIASHLIHFESAVRALRAFSWRARASSWR
jgi:hypothetical protein